MDACAVALKELYDQYGLCAGRHVGLVNYLQEMPKVMTDKEAP